MVTRRKFIGTTALAAGALTVMPFGTNSKISGLNAFQGSATKPPNSKFSGIQIGAITYSWRDQPSSATDIINYCQKSGISSLELMGDVIESYAGLPPSPTELPEKLTGDQEARLDGMIKTSNMTIDEFKTRLEPSVWKMVVAGVIGTTDEQKKWRLSISMTKFEELRRMFNAAGVEIHIAKMSPASWSDGEIDYAFKVAKALGAKGITEEASIENAKRLGPFAEKHGMYAIFHNHFQYADKNFSADPLLAASPANMLNLDSGHYFGSTGLNPADFIKKYHNRIISIHMKDKTGPKTNPPDANQVWGQGEAPIEEILLLLKEHANDKDWPKYADIELEYTVPVWSNSVKEVKTCMAYARQILI